MYYAGSFPTAATVSIPVVQSSGIRKNCSLVDALTDNAVRSHAGSWLAAVVLMSAFYAAVQSIITGP